MPQGCVGVQSDILYIHSLGLFVIFVLFWGVKILNFDLGGGGRVPSPARVSLI